MGTGVLKNHHAGYGGPLATFPVDSLLGGLGNQLRLLQPGFYPGVTPDSSVPLLPATVCFLKSHLKGLL